MAAGLNRALSSEVIKSFEKSILKAERKELLYNYSLVMFEMGDYNKSLECLEEFNKTLTEGKDIEDIAAVKLFKDFVEWTLDKKHEKKTQEAY